MRFLMKNQDLVGGYIRSLTHRGATADGALKSDSTVWFNALSNPERSETVNTDLRGNATFTATGFENAVFNEDQDLVGGYIRSLTHRGATADGALKSDSTVWFNALSNPERSETVNTDLRGNATFTATGFENAVFNEDQDLVGGYIRSLTHRGATADGALKSDSTVWFNALSNPERSETVNTDLRGNATFTATGFENAVFNEETRIWWAGNIPFLDAPGWHRCRYRSAVTLKHASWDGLV